MTFKDSAGTGMEAGVDGEPPAQVSAVTLRFRGDDEMAGLAAAIKWLASRLEPCR